jgi:hypothetical protein
MRWRPILNVGIFDEPTRHMTSRHFSLWIVSPPDYLHSRCFEDVALGLHAAFAALGFDAPIVTDPLEIRDSAIVLGANLLPLLPGPLSPRLILYNLEQIQKDSPWLRPAYIDLLRRYPVWDYSERNIDALKAHGVTNVALCGIGYMPVLTRIPPGGEDVDVLFIGSLNDRRKAVLGEIARHGKKVTVAYNSYGEQRDLVVARAKLLLNVHFYESQIFEMVRVSHLLANRKCAYPICWPTANASFPKPVWTMRWKRRCVRALPLRVTPICRQPACDCCKMTGNARAWHGLDLIVSAPCIRCQC